MPEEEYFKNAVGDLAIRKARRYVDSPDEAPEGADVQEGPLGGYYYDTESLGSNGEEGEEGEVWGSQYIVDEYGEETFSSGSSAAHAAMDSLGLTPRDFQADDGGDKVEFYQVVELAAAAQEKAGYEPEVDKIKTELAAQAAADAAGLGWSAESIGDMVHDLVGGDEEDGGGTADELRSVEPGETVTLDTDKGEYTITFDELDENVTGTSDYILYGTTEYGTRLGIPSEDIRGLADEGEE